MALAFSPSKPLEAWPFQLTCWSINNEVGLQEGYLVDGFIRLLPVLLRR